MDEENIFEDLIDLELASFIAMDTAEDVGDATPLITELEFDNLCLQLAFLDDSKSPERKKKIETLTFIRAALLGNLPEYGIPNVPFSISDSPRDWFKGITFDKTLTAPERIHLNTANEIQQDIDKERFEMDAEYEKWVEDAKQAKKKSKKQKLLLDEVAKREELEERIKQMAMHISTA
jgi:hypothetical protein